VVLKAIVIEPAQNKAEVAFADKEKFNKALRAYPEVLDRNAAMKAMNKFGTMIGMAVTGKSVALPVKNFSGRRCEILEHMCDDFGIDTIELGATIGVCMEGGKIPWGDGEKALGLVSEIIEGTEFGTVLAQGTQVTGEHLGVKRIPCVKGQAMPGYDPRNSKGTGVGYATSPQGADHTVGTTSGSAGDFRNTGRIQMSQKVKVLYALADNFFCHFAALPLASTHKFGIIHIADAFAGKFGGEWTPDRLFGIGLQTLILEKKFNRGAGFTAKDDRLPQFFYEEPSPMTGAVFDFSEEELAQVLPF
jgi:aldehyde:ferredoxin oxidoreductase